MALRLPKLKKGGEAVADTPREEAPVRKKRAVSRGSAPTKRSLNLAVANEKPIDFRIATPAIILIIIGAMLLSKVAVVDRLVEQSNARREVREVQRQIDEGYKKIESFGELTERYAHYTYSGMTQEELERADRVEVMDLIQRIVSPRASVSGWSLKGNELQLVISGSTLQQINLIAQQLTADTMVNYCSVTTAATSDVYRTVETDGDSSVVTANITVYLNSPEEVAQ